MEKTISECFSQIQNGANIKQGIKNGGFPITRIETISSDKFNRDKMGYAGITDASQYENYILEDNDLLMSHINSPQYLGRTVLYKKVDNETIIHGMNLLRLKANKEVNPSYARYYFYGNKFRQQIVKITKKSVNQASFAVNDLKRIKMYLPEMESQNNIVRKLDIISKLIDMHNEILNKYDLLIKARFIEMFRDEKHRMLMSEVCSIITDGTHQPPKFKREGIPFIFVSNIAEDRLTYNAEKFIDQETYDELIKRTPIEIGDVLLSTVGSYGHPAVVKSGKKFLFQRHIAYLKPRREIVDSEFLHGAILSSDVQEQIEKAVKGIAQKTLNLSEIKKMVIPVPTIDRQKKFTNFVQHVDKSREEVKKSLEKTQQLYDSLMQEYFG